MIFGHEEMRGDKHMLNLIGFYDYTVILTYMSVLSALIGMNFSVKGSFSAAILCLLFSGLCDAFDGIVARSKKNRSEDEKVFGIQIDSLCDVVSFGVFPAVICYHMGANHVFGLACICVYVLCAVIRLAFFNVLEGKRQQKEGGCNKTYRGLPVTSISIIFPVLYCLNFVVPETVFKIMLHVMLVLIAFLFVLDFRVKKPDWTKLFVRKKAPTCAAGRNDV